MSGYAPPGPREAKPSVQMARYLQFRRHGHPRAEAATAAGIPIGEAELVDKELAL